VTLQARSFLRAFVSAAGSLPCGVPKIIRAADSDRQTKLYLLGGCLLYFCPFWGIKNAPPKVSAFRGAFYFLNLYFVLAHIDMMCPIKSLKILQNLTYSAPR